jgi:uncharacterized protein
MFGLSFGKLLLLSVLILAVWYGFKYAARVQVIRQSVRDEVSRRRAASPRGASSAKPIEDLVKCSACGAYVSATSTTNCGKAACPWGR